MNPAYSFIRILYHFIKRSLKESNLLINKHFFRVTKKELINKLHDLGIKKGSLIYAHSSLSSFGYIKEGPNLIVDSLIRLIGNEGTIVMPAFTHRTGVFDAETTKCWTGAISETLRMRKNSVRSIHPTHSVVSLGPLARVITKNHEKSKAPFDENSPFAKMIRRNSYILMLGTENNSMIHYVQNKIRFPNLFSDGNYKIKCRINDKIKTITTRIHHPVGSIKYVCRDRICSDVEFLTGMYKNLGFEKRGYMKTVKIGKVTCHLINTIDFIKEATKYLENNIKKYKDEYQSLIKNG